MWLTADLRVARRKLDARGRSWGRGRRGSFLRPHQEETQKRARKAPASYAFDRRKKKTNQNPQKAFCHRWGSISEEEVSTKLSTTAKKRKVRSRSIIRILSCYFPDTSNSILMFCHICFVDRKQLPLRQMQWQPFLIRAMGGGRGWTRSPDDGRSADIVEDPSPMKLTKNVIGNLKSKGHKWAFLS